MCQKSLKLLSHVLLQSFVKTSLTAKCESSINTENVRAAVALFIDID